ncbi:hypothetical protein TD95_001580 [Thielaviopsis punctulata]|uniref:UBR-type domain-containing protein n=1 Tax=Thielaviopsis punctulata TaxID=72032 RepID=A0A0F4ZFX6_9PEZI|nr:hypothetical protein TD95_001580 [Thielaviopsis punctulata]
MDASGSPSASAGSPETKPARSDSISQQTENSQTAADFLRHQMQLEAEAREALPYSIDTCTYSRGPLRQSIFSCLTCNPPPQDLSAPYETAAGICYACSVQCHGDHQLVEIFSKRNFTCDCGTTRMPRTSPCNLRAHSKTGKPGAVGDVAAENLYNHNFRNRFCSCRQEYDPFSQKGTMFQCLGLGSHLEGGCGEDWYHPGCLVGLAPDWYERTGGMKKDDKEPAVPAETEAPKDEDEDAGEEDVPMPEGFPDEDDFETFICFKCLDAHPWAKKYAGQPGFLPPVFAAPVTTNVPEERAEKADEKTEEKSEEKAEDKSKANDEATNEATPGVEAGESKKRKADFLAPDDGAKGEADSKRAKTASAEPEVKPDAQQPEPTPTPADLEPAQPQATNSCRIASISPSSAPFSLFCREDFREHLCTCASCATLTLPFPQLLAEESLYQPSISTASHAADGQSTAGSGSLYERGESALKNMDRVRAIEGVMAYNMMKEKLKPLFEQFAGSGKAIGADDIKDYFAKLRGDEQGMKDAQKAAAEGSAKETDGRREQEGH